jgi:hypothetical protein
MVGALQNEQEKTADRITAATSLADRGWGRPAQTAEIHDGGKTLRDQVGELSPEERAQLRRRVLADLERQVREDAGGSQCSLLCRLLPTRRRAEIAGVPPPSARRTGPLRRRAVGEVLRREGRDGAAAIGTNLLALPAASS